MSWIPRSLCTETNKAIMMEAGAVDRVIELLLMSGNDMGLNHRLVRLLGTFSIGCDRKSYPLVNTMMIYINKACLPIIV